MARAGGAGGLVVQADRAGDAKVRTMVAAAVGEVDRFYLVVNSGGGTRAAIPEMKRNGGGHIG